MNELVAKSIESGKNKNTKTWLLKSQYMWGWKLKIDWDSESKG